MLALAQRSRRDADREETAFIQTRPPDDLRSRSKTGALNLHPLHLVLVSGQKRTTLRIKGLGAFSGAHLELVVNLRPYHQEDRAAGLEPHQHRYIAAGWLGPSKAAVWQNVTRCRKAFAEAYEAVTGAKSPSELVVQGQRQRGFRLDPEARFVVERTEGSS